MKPEKNLRSSRLQNGFIIGSVAVFVSLVILPFYYLYHAPVLGIRTAWDDRAQVWKVESASLPGPFRPGDALVSIDGRRIGFHEGLTDNIHIQSRQELFAWFAAKKALFTLLRAPRVTVGLLRDGGLIHAEVVVRPAQFSFLKRIEALHLVVGTVFFFIGLVVFRKKGFEETSVVFFLLCMAMMLSFITNAASMMSELVYEPACFMLMNLLNIPNPMAIAAFMLHFSLLMPEKRRFLVRFRKLTWLFYASCALIELTLSIGIMNVAFPILFIASLAALGQGYVRYKNPILRRQLLWVVSGFGVGLLPFVLINGIPMIVTGQRLVNDTIPGLFLIVIPLFMAFAIQKHRLMEIESLFDNTLIYAATFGVLTLIDLSAVGLFSRLFPERETAQSLVVSTVTLWFVIVAYVPVRNGFRTWIKRLLKREQYDPNEVSMGLSRRLVLASDTPAVFRETMRAIDESLHPRGRCAYLFTEGETVPVSPEPRADIPREWPSAARTLDSSDYLYRFFPAENLPPDCAAGVLLPIVGPTGPTGCIILKEKISGKTYSREDLNLLDLIARQTSLALESIVAKEAAAMKEKESREVKEQISREMHDGIGGSFSNAMMILDLMSGELTGPAAVSRRIGAMRDTLADGLTETRILIRTMEGQETALSDLRESIAGKVQRLLGGKEMGCTFETD
ncbi:MAG: histidine kinase, partial [Deltaproteobacteria bacterium]|nr:histidine kinase [Deltaproteobacteria bacterium]